MPEGQIDHELYSLAQAIEVHHLEPGHQYLLVVDKHQVSSDVCRRLLTMLKDRGIKGILLTANGLPAMEKIEL